MNPQERREADQALVELGRGIVKDLRAGYWSHEDAANMIESLALRLDALTKEPSLYELFQDYESSWIAYYKADDDSYKIPYTLPDGFTKNPARNEAKARIQELSKVFSAARRAFQKRVHELCAAETDKERSWKIRCCFL